MLVSRPSHSHQVPHAGLPHSDPVTRHSAVKIAPGTAEARAANPASGCRHTSSTRLAMAIALHPPMPSQAVGTWMNRMRTLSPCNRSAGAWNRPYQLVAAIIASPLTSSSGVSHRAIVRKRFGLAKPCIF